MWEGFIGKQVRRANNRLLIANLCVLAFVAVLLGANANYLNNWFRGTNPTDPQAIARLRNPNDLARNFVSFDVAKVFESGYQEIETENGRQTGVNADFQVVWVGDRALVVKTKPGSTATHMEGGLVTVPQEVMDGLRQQLKPEEQGVLLPFMLDTVNYREDGYWFLGISLPLLALAGWNLSKWVKRTSDFAQHPIVKALGGQQAVIQYGAQIEMEMTAGGEKIGAATLTANWIAVPYYFGTHMARLDDLVWVYKKITKHSYNFIPTGKTYEALLWRRNGTSVSVSGKEKQVDGLLQKLVNERIPWVIPGFSAELDNAWKKDRAGFLAAVDQRRGKAKPGSAAAAAHA